MKLPDEYVLDLVTGSSERRRMLEPILRRVCDRLTKKIGRNVKLWLDDVPILLRAVDAFEGVRTAAVVVADLTDARADVMLELGVRLGIRKPFVLVSDETVTAPFELTEFYRFVYTRNGGEEVLAIQLAERIEEILRNPAAWEVPWRDINKPGISTVFVSYSHVDAAYLARLRTHLKPLERAGLIDLWDDTKIRSGDKWKEIIAVALERAAVAVLLISADFLASDFIDQNELPPLLRAAEEKGTWILPLIVKPCGFARNKNLSLFQAHNDPAKPLISMSESEQESAYARLAERIEAVIGA